MARYYSFYCISNSNTPNVNGDYRYYFDVSSEQDVANNQSTVYSDAYIQVSVGIAGDFDFSRNLTYRSSIDGTLVSAIKYLGFYTSNATVYLGKLQRTISHNLDGTKSFVFQGSGTDFVQGVFQSTSSVTITLPTIPRASTVTATNADIGSATSININRASSSFTHTLKYSFGSLNGTIATGIATNYGWTVPTTFYAQIPNSKTGTCTITCETYNGSTLIGTKTTTFTAIVDEMISSPIVNYTFQDSNALSTALTGDNQIIVKHVSNAQITVTATPRNSATITNVKIVCEDGKQASGSSSPLNATLNSVESGNFTAYATDSRGYINSLPFTSYDFVNYVKLTLNATFYRTLPTNNEVAVNFSGNYFNGSFGTESNTLELKFRYKENGTTTWSSYSNITPTIVGNTYSGTTVLGTDFDYTKKYDIELVALDKIYTAGSIKRTSLISEGKPVFALFEDGANVNGTFTVNDEQLLSANDLARSVRYLLATAGSNGDFNLTIDGASGLAVNDIIRVAFPSATVPTANARLSIDGGTTYINIRNFNNIPLDAVAIQNQNIELYFDGTNFRETTLKRDMITVRSNVDYNIVANDTYETPPYVIYNQIGNRLTFSANRVIIGSGVRKVKISAQAYWVVVGGSSANRFFSFFNGAAATLHRSALFTLNERNNIYWTDFIQTVAKGDQLNFQVYGKIGDRVGLLGTFFTIEVVE